MIDTIGIRQLSDFVSFSYLCMQHPHPLLHIPPVFIILWDVRFDKWIIFEYIAHVIISGLSSDIFFLQSSGVSVVTVFVFSRFQVFMNESMHHGYICFDCCTSIISMSELQHLASFLIKSRAAMTLSDKWYISNFDINYEKFQTKMFPTLCLYV